MERKGPADLLLFFITLILLAIGLIMVLSASSYAALLTYDDALFFFKCSVLLWRWVLFLCLS